MARTPQKLFAQSFSENYRMIRAILINFSFPLLILFSGCGLLYLTEILPRETVVTALVICVVVVLLIGVVLNNLDKQRESQEKLIEMQKVLLKDQGSINNAIQDSQWQSIYTDKSGGYIIYDLPNSQRTLFHDLLKGFESYAALKGYSISFSIDNSIENKIAFKFTIINSSNGVNVGTDSVRNDIQEYIKKIQENGNIDEMPIIINREEHYLILTNLKNRLNFIEHSYKLEKVAREFYETLINKIKNSNIGIHNQPNIYINSGGTQIPYQIQSSLFQGDNISQTGNTYENVTITYSFNERKEQIAKIEEILNRLPSENILEKIRTDFTSQLKQVLDELANKEKPSKATIGGAIDSMLKQAKALTFSHDFVDALNWLYKSFFGST